MAAHDGWPTARTLCEINFSLGERPPSLRDGDLSPIRTAELTAPHAPLQFTAERRSPGRRSDLLHCSIVPERLRCPDSTRLP